MSPILKTRDTCCGYNFRDREQSATRSGGTLKLHSTLYKNANFVQEYYCLYIVESEGRDSEDLDAFRFFIH